MEFTGREREMFKPRFVVLLGMVLAAAASRLMPHPPNFTPIAALALFGGACFSNKRAAFFAPLASLFLSDLVLGLYRGLPVVYGSFAMIVCIGFWLRRRRTWLPIAGAALGSSVLFFVVTNFGVWALESVYPKTTSGLIACYVAAIPFFRNTLLGDALYCLALFGGLALVERWIPAVREQAEWAH